MKPYLAHRMDESSQLLADHLNSAAKMAADFAAPFGAADAAYFCGLMHDIGKYSEAFQQRIRGKAIQVDHSTAGALEAQKCGQSAAAFCIAGHHRGLPDRGSRMDSAQSTTLLGRLKRRPGIEIEPYAAFRNEISVPACGAGPALTSPEAAFFYTHMLYSCLVDADWLDTERFMQNGTVDRKCGEALPALMRRLEKYAAKWWDSREALNQRRTKILRQLMQAGEKPQGLYTLTVPTGGGKTVSSMAFALRHALHNGARRIIYIIPYTSIIEQTQEIFEDIFGAENVVAHYANVEYPVDESGDLSEVDRRRYLAAENWDAPIILTTAVQFFESLFGNRPARCRKLHNIAGSVLIFDEAQMLPINDLRPCVWSITELVRSYGCTAVLCTATQPSLRPIIEDYLPGGVQELCPDVAENYEFFRRVSYRSEGLLPDDELARRLTEERAVLCVVNSRAQAQKLFAMLPPEGAYHLSTTMTPAHRRRVLAIIKEHLKIGEACRVISTSLIEAGVDVNFPCVYRAVAGLDSIIQAAGRCNREGKPGGEKGIVHIFDTETKPPQALEQNIAAARYVLERFPDPSMPEAVQAYFDFLLYALKDKKALDAKESLPLIRGQMAFETVAKRFRLIDSETITVYIPQGEGERLVARLRKDGPSRGLMRQLGQYAVSVYPYTYRQMEDAGAVERISENAAILLLMSNYDEKTGLRLSPEGGEALLY